MVDIVKYRYVPISNFKLLNSTLNDILQEQNNNNNDAYNYSQEDVQKVLNNHATYTFIIRKASTSIYNKTLVFINENRQFHKIGYINEYQTLSKLLTDNGLSEQIKARFTMLPKQTKTTAAPIINARRMHAKKLLNVIVARQKNDYKSFEQKLRNNSPGQNENLYRAQVNERRRQNERNMEKYSKIIGQKTGGRHTRRNKRSKTRKHRN